MLITPMAANPAAHDTSSTNGASSGSGLGSLGDTTATFLSLITAELQSQDPTAPLDPNQMVSQIVSLGQLDQLIQINQTLSGGATGGTTPTGSVTPSNSLSNL
jgi:flagellar basal-body rod modification protein FlgD